jgi:ABC-type sugar transport system ATPase subunit
LGENGAGKSTLIKAVAGAINLDGGIIQVGGQDYQHMTPHLSRRLGIEVIYQEFNLVETMSAAENIFLGDRVSPNPLVDYGAMRSKARELFDLFNVDIDPNALVRQLSSAKKQIVEIAKAVSKNVKILIMDEPSAPLSVTEVEHMFEIINRLKQKGVTIIYISHRLEEVFRISDRVSVMRDGQYVATKMTKDTNRRELISLMVGRELKETYPPRANPPGEIALEVKNLTGNGDHDISFSVRKGEILGISGLVGAGRTELAMLLFGAAPIESGEIWVDGQPVKIRSSLDAIQHGMGLLTEDRKGKGLFLEMGVGWNISFPIVRKLSKFGVVDTKTEQKITEQYRQRIDIKTPNMEQRVINLSGGNQQKVVLAKSLAAESDILIFDEPTRGIDVGAKQEIYNLMCELADGGQAILMISSDMEELLGMSDRIIVLCEGKLAGEVNREQFSQDYILDLASGTH